VGTVALKRQVITDAQGTAVAVLLPIEEYEQLRSGSSIASRDARDDAMERAAQDPRFLYDLSDSMTAFAAADA